MIIEAFDRNGNRIWKGRTTNTATVPELHGQDIGHFEGRVYKDEDND